MFRIDLKGVYADKDRSSILEANRIGIDGTNINLDSFENLIVNKLLFGSQIDLEDALAVLTKNHDKIDFDKLQLKAKNLDLEDELEKLIKLFNNLEN